MKIGIHFFTTAEDIGGGFTYGEQVVKAFSQYSKNAKHELCLFVPFTLSYIEKHAFFKEVIVAEDKPLPILSRLNRYTRRKMRMHVEVPLNSLQQAIIQEAPDVIYFIDPFFAVDTDVPHIVTVWDLAHRLQPYFPEVRIMKTWEKREAMYLPLLGKAAAVIVGSEAGRNQVMQFYGIPSENIFALTHPTPAFALQAGNGDESILGKLNVNTQEYLFYPAQFWAHKNHVAILDVILKLKQKALNMKAVFSGSDKGNKEYIQNLAKQMGIDDRIVFAGFVSREELIALYRNAFALSYSSFFGPENLPPLEAFALGCPAIVADAIGIREQLGDAALYFSPEKPDELFDQVLALCNPDLRNNLIAKGRKISQEKKVENFAKGFFDIIDKFAPIRRTWK